MKKLPIGTSDFKELIENNLFFIDKSLFVKEIIEDDSKVILLPRPRRFGKTVNISMLRYFFEKTDNKDRTVGLFSGLKIEKEKLFDEHICRYPVIYFSFKNIKKANFEKNLEAIELLISDEFMRHNYLLDSEVLNEVQKNRFEDIMNMRAKSSVLENSLLDLSRYLYEYHKEKPVILIDEYDTPIINGYIEGFYKDTVTFFRSFLGAGLKDNHYVKTPAKQVCMEGGDIVETLDTTKGGG